MEEKQVRKITLGFVLGWILGIIFLLAGFVSIFSTGFLVGILMMLMGFILLPPANTLLANKFKFVISGGLKFVLIVVLFVVIGIVAGGKAKEEGYTDKDTENSVVQDTEETPTEEVDDRTLGEKNALRSASNYLSTMPFSYTGLIKQLEYEGYTQEQAEYGAKAVGY